MFCSLSLSHDQNCSYVADCLRPLSPVSPPHCLLRRGDPDGDIIRFWNRSMANVCRTTLMEKSRTSMILATWIHSFEVFILMHGGCAHFDERLKVTCIKHTYTYKNTESALKEMQTGPAELMKALIRARGNSTCFFFSCQCIGTEGLFLLGVSQATLPSSSTPARASDTAGVFPLGVSQATCFSASSYFAFCHCLSFHWLPGESCAYMPLCRWHQH